METVQDLIKQYRENGVAGEFSDDQVVAILLAFYKTNLEEDACEFDFIKELYEKRVAILEAYKQ